MRSRTVETGAMAPVTSTRTPLSDLAPDALAGFLADKQAAYADLQARGLKLDLTRGKPSSAQLDLSERLLASADDHQDRSGVDVRNYGGLEGLTELPRDLRRAAVGRHSTR